MGYIDSKKKFIKILWVEISHWWLMASSVEDLFSSNDSSLWRASLNTYSKVLALKEAEKKKKPKYDLVKLDKW